MKRFWIILLIIIITSGLLFLTFLLISDNEVKVEFKKLRGSESEVKNIILSGIYEGKEKHLLKITPNKTIDINTDSFFYKIGKKEETHLPIMDLLKYQYPDFMVDKELNPAYFYKDEKFLAYSYIKRQSFRLEIEVLNRQTNQITLIKYDIPEKEKYEQLVVDEVQVINGELKVIVSGYLQNDSDVMYVYTFDIKEQEFLNWKTIDKVQNGGIKLENNPVIHPEKYLLINRETFGSDPSKSEYFFYNLETDQIKKWPGFYDIPNFLWYRMTFFNSIFYIPISSDKGLEVKRYNIEKEKWESTLNFPYGYIKEDYNEIPFQDDDFPFIQLMNGKLYVIRPVEDGQATIHIGDLNTGELLYEGELIVNKPLEERKGYHLSITGLDFADAK